MAHGGVGTVGLGFAQKSIEVVETQDQELVPLEPSEIGAERGSSVLGTSHTGEPTPQPKLRI